MLLNVATRGSFIENIPFRQILSTVEGLDTVCIRSSHYILDARNETGHFLAQTRPEREIFTILLAPNVFKHVVMIANENGEAPECAVVLRFSS